MNEIKNGVLHCHTDNSNRDSVMTVQMLVETSKKHGAPAVALTDHGSMTGYIDFIQTCEENKIKPIVGVEAYVEEESEGRKHLILMAKDYEGFTALIKAVSESNTRVVSAGKLAFPRMNKAILVKYFGPGTAGHGHVIATSACVSGVLASVVLANDSIDEELTKLRTKQLEFDSPESEGYLKNNSMLTDLQSTQKELSAEISTLKKIATRSLLSLERKALNAPAGSEKQKNAQAEFDAANQARFAANAELISKTAEKEAIEVKIKRIKPIINQIKNGISRWERIQKDIDAILKNHIDDAIIDQVLEEEALWYQDTFGVGNFYIELQYHGLSIEKRVMPRLAELSDQLNIPVCLANDAHIPDKTGDSILARAIIRTTMFEKWDDPSAADKEVYIKTDDELTEMISRIIPREKVLEGYANIGKIVSDCNLELPKENHYPKFQTPDDSSVEEYLRKLAYDSISRRYTADEFTEEHQKRLEHELNTICSMGYADYHCIVEDFLRYARAAGKLDLTDPEEEKIALSFDIEKIEKHVRNRPGECVGPGRGSAAGSLVCYLIGITNIDPIKYGLLFERFLNPERISMPDIDCDIETNVRAYTIMYVKYKYGNDSVCGIMTRGTQTGKAAIRTAGRVYGIQKADDSTAYLDIVDELSKKTVDLAESELHIDLKAIQPQIEKLFASNQVALEIYHYALLIEGCATQVGRHAAGIIITDGRPVDDYVPLIYNSKHDIMMTQCDMNQSEQLGLLKMDFLGLNNLTIITETVQEIYAKTGVVIDMDKIPMDDKAVYKKIYAAAMTNSIFQFESPGMKNMLRNFKPDNIFDLILLVAMFRPGPMQYLPDVIAVKNGRKEMTFLTPQLKPILENTYGSITYQEQVQEIFKQLAGYSFGQADLVRRAMSKKKNEILMAEKGTFLHGDQQRNIPGCIKNNISEEVATGLFEEMTDFAKYAFNKSHAACYAVVSYQTAWLKYHYPREYMKSVLNNTDFEKIPGLVDDLRSMNIKILAPNVNRSELRFSIEDESILFGLGNLKGLGESAAVVVSERKSRGEYRSMQDFILRTQPSKKILEGLTSAGAFDSFCCNRQALTDLTPDYLGVIKKIKDYSKKLGEAYEPKKINAYIKKIAEYTRKLEGLLPDMDVCEDQLAKLKREKDIIGVYVSMHPMELFPEPSKNGAIRISDAHKCNNRDEITITGIVSNFALKPRKKDKVEMGFFTLSDLSGRMEICCFTKVFAEFKPMIMDDAVISITGNIMVDQNDSSVKKLSVDEILILKLLKKVITIYTTGRHELQESLWNLITPYVSRNGNPLRIYDLGMDEYIKSDLLVTPAIAKNKNIRSSLQDI